MCPCDSSAEWQTEDCRAQCALTRYCPSELNGAPAKVIAVINEHMRLLQFNVCLIACFFPPPVFLGVLTVKTLGSLLLKTWSVEHSHHPETFWECRILAISQKQNLCFNKMPG